MELFFMLVIGAGAVFFDLRSGKIPNGLILTGYAVGLCCQTAKSGIAGILLFLGGAGLPVILMWLLFYLRMMGAGDIKLLSVMGGFLGIPSSFYFLIAAILAGGAVSVFVVLIRCNFRSRMQCFLHYCKQCMHGGGWKPYDQEDLRGGTFCFSIPIFISVLLYAGGIY